LVVLRKEMNLQEQMRFEPALAEDANGRFARVAKELVPDDLTVVDLGWRSIHLISYKGTTLGCTSPLTFVCPSATKPSNGKALTSITGCNWFSDGAFRDPIEAAESSFLQILQAWIKRTTQKLSPGQQGEPDRVAEFKRADYLEAVRANELRRELASFDKDIQKRLDVLLKKSQFQIAAADIREEVDSSFQTSSEIQECLRKVVFSAKGYTETHVKNSPFLLKPAPGANPRQLILLIHNSLARHPNYDGGKVEVLRGFSLNRALEEYEVGTHDQIKSVNVTPGAIYSAEEIFCDKIFVAETEKGFPGAHEFAGVSALRKNEGTAGLSPVLPLRSDFVDYFTPEYLVKNVEFSGSQDEITVSLRVGLGTANTTPVSFFRTYRLKDRQIEFGRLPELRIWPEYNEKELPGWKAWYLYYNDLSVPTNKLYVAPRPEYQTQASSGETKPVQSRITDNIDKLKRVEIHRCALFPAVLECALERRQIGVILAKATERTEARTSGDWEVSIDFGTTGTSVFYSRDRQIKDIGILRLEPCVLSVTSAGDVGETYRFFLPTELANTDGILSIFKEFKAVQTDPHGMSAGSNEVTPLLGGHVSFLHRSKDMGQNKNFEADGVYADMKWGTSADQARGKAFLMQLCLLTALQAKISGARSIGWVFSYPLSFSRARYDNFRNLWRNCVSFALDLSGLEPTDPKSPFRERNESMCAAKFAQDKHNADIGGGSIILDIGGGSTDISIWANPGGLEPKCIGNTSVKFAGRDIFQRPLKSKPDLLTHFITNEPMEKFVRGLTNPAVQNESIFFSQIDSLFKFQSVEVLKLLDSKQSEPVVKAFIGILSMGLRGLFFYTGTLLKVLATRGSLEEKLPDVFVCGNGGKILHWLNYGHFEEGANAERRLLRALRAGSGFPIDSEKSARITLSAQPKTEAAYGMLVDPEEKSKGIEYERGPVIGGEVYKLGDRLFDVLDRVPFDDLKEKSFIVSDELPAITAFIEASEQQKLPARTQRDIVARTNNRLTAIAKRLKDRKADDADSQAELEQPIFIIALNELIQQAAQDWAAGRVEPWWL